VKEFTRSEKMASKITGSGMGGVVLVIGEAEELNKIDDFT